jgi:hypothetical protein
MRVFVGESEDNQSDKDQLDMHLQDCELALSDLELFGQSWKTFRVWLPLPQRCNERESKRVYRLRFHIDFRSPRI